MRQVTRDTHQTAMLTQQGVGVEPPKVLDNVPRVAVPMEHPAVGLYPIDKCTTGVLQRKG